MISDAITTAAQTSLQNQNKNLSPVNEAAQEMGMDDFLQLLTTQLTNQDPLEPMKDTDFIAQMAGITQMEQMQKFTSDFSQYLGDQQAVASHSYLGKLVTVSGGAEGSVVRGMVDSVQKESDDSVTVTINGVSYDTKNVLKVELSGDQTNL